MSAAPNYNLQLLAERMRSVNTGKVARMPATPPPAPAKVYNMLTLQEAADECRVSLATFRKWPVKRFEEGGVVLIRRQDLEEFIASRIVDRHDAPCKSTRGESDGERSE
jgi:hypothetical protein